MTTLNEVIERSVNKINAGLLNLIFAGLSIEKIEKIPDWLLENIEKNKQDFDIVINESQQELLKEVVELTTKEQRKYANGEDDYCHGAWQALEDIKSLLIPNPPSTQPE